jgi:Ca2+-binding EF-hand superfamily protein
MNLAKLLLIGVSALALGTGAALGADKAKSDPGFNKLDANHDGYLSRAEAAKNPHLVKNFKQADKNGDGKLSRTEYLSVMTKKDLKDVKDKVAGNKDRSAASGSSKQK